MSNTQKEKRMKDFIKKNDRYLHRAKIFLTVYLIIMAIIIGILAILMFVNQAVGAGIGILIGGIIGLVVFDFLVKLFLSFLVDVKLIRNKLYKDNDEANDEELKTFYEA